jgi:hypothetical protein
MRFLAVTQDKVNPFNLGQLLVGPLGIAANSHHQGIRIATARLLQQTAAFAVGNMGNSAGIEYIDISPISHRYQLIPRLGKLPG